MALLQICQNLQVSLYFVEQSKTITTKNFSPPAYQLPTKAHLKNSARTGSKFCGSKDWKAKSQLTHDCTEHHDPESSLCK